MRTTRDTSTPAPPRTLGGLIYQKRKELGLGLRESARAVGISASLMSAIEAGQRFPSDPILEKLAAWLQLEPSVLRRYDIRVTLQDLKHLLVEFPDLAFGLQQVLQRIDAGLVTVGDLVSALQSKELLDNG